MPFWFSSSFWVKEKEPCSCSLERVVLVPENANIGADKLKGNAVPNINLKMERKSPRGNHMKKAREDGRVGLKANLPSWKINGLGYLSLGRTSQFLLSSELKVKQNFCRGKKEKLKAKLNLMKNKDILLK